MIIRFSSFLTSIILLSVAASADETINNPTNITPKHPNILFILADDLGYGDVACYNP